MKKIVILLSLAAFSTAYSANVVNLEIQNNTKIKNGWKIYVEEKGRWRYKKRLRKKGDYYQLSVNSPYKIKLKSRKKFYLIDENGNIDRRKRKIEKEIEGTDSKTYTIKYEEKVKETEDDPGTINDETDRTRYQYPDNYVVESSAYQTGDITVATAVAATTAKTKTTPTVSDVAERYKITINIDNQEMPRPKRGKKGWKAKISANKKWITRWHNLPYEFDKIEKGRKAERGKPLPSNFTIQLRSKGKYQTQARATQYFTVRKDVSDVTSNKSYTLKIKTGMPGTREDDYELVEE